MRDWMWMLIGAAIGLYAVGKLCVVVFQATALHRMAAALEDEALMHEMQMLEETVLTREPASALPAQTKTKAADEEKITSLMVSKGAQRISERRAEAGF